MPIFWVAVKCNGPRDNMTIDFKKILKDPVLLSPDHFTALSRTPWAGKENCPAFQSIHSA